MASGSGASVLGTSIQTVEIDDKAVTNPKLSGGITGDKFARDDVDYFLSDEMVYDDVTDIPFETEGTVSQADAGIGVIDVLTGGAAGNRARLNMTSTSKRINPTKTQFVKLLGNNTAQTNAHDFVGLFSALPTAAVPPVDPANGIYFRNKNAGAVVNWFAVSRKANVETAVDTGISATAQPKFMEIRITSTEITYYIDDVLVATISTNLPTVSLFWGVITVTQVATVKSFGIDMMLLTGKR